MGTGNTLSKMVASMKGSGRLTACRARENCSMPLEGLLTRATGLKIKSTATELFIIRIQGMFNSSITRISLKSATIGVLTKVNIRNNSGSFEFDMKNGNGTLTLCNG